MVRGTAGLAEHLGVSRWTVSRVLNGHEGVKEATRRRVLEAVDELGFAPNMLARSLRGVPSGVVGVSFPHLEAAVLAQKSQVLQQALGEAGYRGIFEMPNGDPEVEAEVVRHFLSIQVDGIVLMGSVLPADAGILEEVAERGVAMVAVDPRERLPVAQVSLDRGKAMRQVLDHLFGLGHRRFGILGFASDDLYPEVRRRGLVRAASRLGLDPARDLVSFDLNGYQQQDYRYGAELAREVLSAGNAAPRALIFLNDRLAIGAMNALRAAGKRVPGDFSIIGFDNLAEAAWTEPALTTVDQNVEALMREASGLLWEPPVPGKRTPVRRISPTLVVRASTAGKA